ncbi:glycoside hydrolase family 6 protein [Pseudovirgaria hyperparasitica]|uniref:Glucanase n=1 Tax=Pseudovirgaria hyperparasitica TaxID=470096 RepID=A0A6A6W8D6_9PEZI|nr:glycoside hydrolase family 6 protein [Pseudovirgaria hyperparasitica]KAF2759148.1 glycoside hydrolase family 6 protein [Pseudovirgaria hyperparasitica]
MLSLALTVTALAAFISASPADLYPNPFINKAQFVNPAYAAKLNTTIASFEAKHDTLNADRTRTAQNISTFVWVTRAVDIAAIPVAVTAARTARWKTGKDQIIGLVHYNLPDRDCSAGESAGEFSSAKNGLELYKRTFVDKFAMELEKARDLTFAVVLEPDSLGNVVTNQGIEFCKNATKVYEDGLAYAIQKLQYSHVHLYVDAAHGGWLGWDDNLPLAAAEFSKVIKMAGPHSRIRGFSTNVSNFNPYIANPRANYTQYSNSYDELHYAQSLTPHLLNNSLPAHFIIDQGRAGLQNQRAEWGEWCNVKAGYGLRPSAKTGSELVDAIVWVKPGGESDGKCGLEGAPGSGQWFNAYVEGLVKDANPVLDPLK